jgi:hypothetical protein
LCNIIVINAVSAIPMPVDLGKRLWETFENYELTHINDLPRVFNGAKEYFYLKCLRDSATEPVFELMTTINSNPLDNCKTQATNAGSLFFGLKLNNGQVECHYGQFYPKYSFDDNGCTTDTFTAKIGANSDRLALYVNLRYTHTVIGCYPFDTRLFYRSNGATNIAECSLGAMIDRRPYFAMQEGGLCFHGHSPLSGTPCGAASCLPECTGSGNTYAGSVAQSQRTLAIFQTPVFEYKFYRCVSLPSTSSSDFTSVGSVSSFKNCADRATGDNVIFGLSGNTCYYGATLPTAAQSVDESNCMYSLANSNQSPKSKFFSGFAGPVSGNQVQAIALYMTPTASYTYLANQPTRRFYKDLIYGYHSIHVSKPDTQGPVGLDVDYFPPNFIPDKTNKKTVMYLDAVGDTIYYAQASMDTDTAKCSVNHAFDGVTTKVRDARNIDTKCEGGAPLEITLYFKKPIYPRHYSLDYPTNAYATGWTLYGCPSPDIPSRECVILNQANSINSWPVRTRFFSAKQTSNSWNYVRLSVTSGAIAVYDWRLFGVEHPLEYFKLDIQRGNAILGTLSNVGTFTCSNNNPKAVISYIAFNKNVTLTTFSLKMRYWYFAPTVKLYGCFGTPPNGLKCAIIPFSGTQNSFPLTQVIIDSWKYSTNMTVAQDPIYGYQYYGFVDETNVDLVSVSGMYDPNYWALATSAPCSAS